MAESHIQVGKYTLESLTTGMYSDPKIIYREYIQNSVDSLENALEQHLIEPQSMRIDIIVDEENSYISIRDNGTGIPYNKAVNTLMNIGSSAKRHTNNRGFRGIGRLGGMSYCDNLIFSTSAEGENKKTIIEFDCKKLRQILVPGAYEEMDLAAVMAAVTNTFVELEKEEKQSLDQMFGQLEEVIGKMEGEDVSLEESFELYSRGMNLLKQCSQAIDEVEKKVLVLDENGETHEF